MKGSDRLVKDYNNGDIESVIEILGGSIQLLYQILDKKEKFDELNFGTEETSDYTNEYLFYLVRNYPEKFKKIAVETLNDIEINSDDELVYIASDYEDLASFFCEGRYSLSRDSIEHILDDERDNFEFFFEDTTDDLYRDVVEDLTEENLQLLTKRLSNESPLIKPTTELLTKLASGQNNEGLVKINEEILDEILEDEKSTLSVLNQNQDIKSDLYSIHNSAYNDAYFSEVRKNVLSGLGELFEGIPKRKPGFNNKKFYVEIKLQENIFFEVLQNFLEQNRNWREETLEKYGYFRDIFNEIADCLSTFAPEYADWTKTKENINLIFSDYF
jgi:hypothetical protein